MLLVQPYVGFPYNDTVAECLTWLSGTLALHDRFLSYDMHLVRDPSTECLDPPRNGKNTCNTEAFIFQIQVPHTCDCPTF